MASITPFLMFTGQAEEAMNYYLSIFEDSAILSLQHYGPNEAGAEGSVRLALLSLNGQRFMCIDSTIQHAFTFTPALSLYVTCRTEQEVDLAFTKLSDGGQVLMPLQAYPFSPRFCWVNDKFGLSWQLSLAAES